MLELEVGTFDVEWFRWVDGIRRLILFRSELTRYAPRLNRMDWNQ